MRAAACAVLAALVAGCVFGPRQLEKGHLAYNSAVQSAADDELLLNVVRIRYLDSLEFMATTSISSQLVFTATLGARGGTDTLSGDLGALGRGELTYTTRPTFTFSPQRGSEFAERLVEPVPVSILAYLVAADWDTRVLFRLLVRRLNEIDNELGLPNEEFVEATDRLANLQLNNRLFVGFIQSQEAISDPVAARQVSGTDVVEAAKAGYQFRREPNGELVLTAARPQTVLALTPGSEDVEEVERLLGLEPDRPYYPLDAGTRLGPPRERADSVTVRTGSLMRAITYLSQGVSVPEAHVERGLTTREWPPGAPGSSLAGLFQMRSSEDRPDARLAVKHRGYWFYIADDDQASRYTFFHLSELLRLGLAPEASQDAPVLTLPVGP